jgi:hypothetical protein
VNIVGRVTGPEFVPVSSELNRVSRIPRRTMSPSDLEWLAAEMTARLRKPRGTMQLRPIQAWALYELATVGGLFGPITVGGGKTLISFLAPVVMKAERTLLVVPAGLIEKTKRDKEILDQHWHLPPFIRMKSYEWLGREEAGEDRELGRKSALEEWKPDLILLDECHRAKNKNAAVVRRLTRFFRAFPNARCGAFSGSATKRSILDYAHILAWCLPEKLFPLPTNHRDLTLWSDALDEKKDSVKKVDPGGLEILCVDQADRQLWLTDRVKAARHVFRRRMVETPGVVATHESSIDSTLIVRGVAVGLGPEVDDAFADLRELWETPDGWTIPDGVTFARHARELALGFYYIWDPRPPVDWQSARADWHKYVRSVLKHSRTHDSEKQVRNWVLTEARKLLPEGLHKLAVELATPPRHHEKRTLNTRQRSEAGAHLVQVLLAGARKPEDVEGPTKLFAWKGIQDTFEPNTVPVWIDSAACSFATEWAREAPGIIWVEHRCVGERLEREFGLTYYGRKGLNARGQFIDDHDPKQSLVASRPANGEGRNLQKWSRNLIMSLLPNGARNEQLLGRTHRPGQTADEITFEFLVSCVEHLEGFEQAMKDARYIEHSTGAPQKLLLATVDVDEKRLRGAGPRWNG